MLQADGERRVGQRIERSESRQCQRRDDGLFGPASVAQRTHQAVMRFHVRRVGGNGGAKRLRCLIGRPGSKQIESALRKQIGSGGVGRVHGFL